jgi:hypothetical protein
MTLRIGKWIGDENEFPLTLDFSSFYSLVRKPTSADASNCLDVDNSSITPSVLFPEHKSMKYTYDVTDMLYLILYRNTSVKDICSLPNTFSRLQIKGYVSKITGKHEKKGKYLHLSIIKGWRLCVYAYFLFVFPS